MYQLRPYQQKIVKLSLDALEGPPGRFIIALPTGMGKTVCIAEIARKTSKRLLFLAHRKELIEQAREKLVTCGIPKESISTVLRSAPDTSKPIWVASIQTLIRGDRLKMITPELIIIDECHHSAAVSYRKILDTFPNAHVLGFTATPTRTSPREKKILASIWDGILYNEYSIKRAILEGWLANIYYYSVKTDIDISRVKSTGGDYQEKDLANTVNMESRNKAIVDKYIELGGGKAIVFCVNIQHCNAVAAEFEAKDSISQVNILTGKTKKEEREKVIKRFKVAPPWINTVTINCMVLTEGFDCPDIRQVILARPTKSPIVYMQQLGRGTRKAPAKDNVIVLDITDNAGDKQLCNCLSTVFNISRCREISITGDVTSNLRKMQEGASEPETGGKSEKKITQERVEIILNRFLFDMPFELEKSRLAWFSIDEKQYICHVSKGHYWLIEDTELAYKLFAVGKKKTFHLESADIKELAKFALGKTEEFYADTRFIWDKSKRESWSNDPATEKQRRMLVSIDPQLNLDHVSKATASEIINAFLSKRQK